MASLWRIAYNPTTAATPATTAAAAAVAFDTTNLRAPNIVMPRNGCIWWRIHGQVHGATSCPQILGCVLEGAAVVGRAAPQPNNMGASASNRFAFECQGWILGTPGTVHTYDAAFGVEAGVASSAIKYGGPNDATTNNAFGALVFEGFESDNLLNLAAGGGAALMYDPASVGTKATSTLAAAAVIDSTNLRLTNVQGPQSGQAEGVLRIVGEGSSTFQGVLIGFMEGAAVLGLAAPVGGKFDMAGLAATTMVLWEARVPFPLAPGNHTIDAAFGVEIATASTVFAMGGPNDTTASNAWGAASMEIWAA